MPRIARSSPTPPPVLDFRTGAKVSLAPAQRKELARLAKLAQNATRQAYAPYSQFRVGCALVSAQGRTHLGCNVENASYGLTNCAERVAIGAGVAAEGRGFKVARAFVWVEGANTCFPPCGACRQVLSEFALPAGGQGTEIYWPDGTVWRRALMADLLPGAFQL